MTKKIVCLLVMILISPVLSGCREDKDAAQKEAKMQELLSQKTKDNVRIEKWSVAEITPSSSATKIVKIFSPNTDKMKILEVEGNYDLEAGMDVIIEIRVADLSLNTLVDGLKNREFIKILYY